MSNGTVSDINLRGTFIGAREAAKRMVAAHKGGVIINLASTAGYQGGASIAHYVASKHGVRGLTKSLAIELGPHNIRVLALAPTLISTPGISESGLDTSAFESLPLGRVGVPDDVGRVDFLRQRSLDADDREHPRCRCRSFDRLASISHGLRVETSKRVV